MSEALRLQVVEIIEATGESDRAVARRAHIDPSNLTHIKPDKKKSDPSVGTLEALASACGYTLALVPNDGDQLAAAAAPLTPTQRDWLTRLARALPRLEVDTAETEVEFLEIRAGLRDRPGSTSSSQAETSTTGTSKKSG